MSRGAPRASGFRRKKTPHGRNITKGVWHETGTRTWLKTLKNFVGQSIFDRRRTVKTYERNWRH
jgi:hypothetical protein